MLYRGEQRIIVAVTALSLVLPIVAQAMDKHDAMEGMLVDLQEQWQENAQIYESQQREIHEAANKLRQELCNEGVTDHCEDRKPQAKAVEVKKAVVPQIAFVAEGKKVDIDRLAYAVAVAETSNCTAGTGKSRNNCHGIFGRREDGSYGPRTFATTDESFEEFKRLWLTKYCDCFPSLELAKKYSGGPGTDWLRRVTVAYNRDKTSEHDVMN